MLPYPSPRSPCSRPHPYRVFSAGQPCAPRESGTPGQVTPLLKNLQWLPISLSKTQIPTGAYTVWPPIIFLTSDPGCSPTKSPLWSLCCSSSRPLPRTSHGVRLAPAHPLGEHPLPDASQGNLLPLPLAAPRRRSLLDFSRQLLALPTRHRVGVLLSFTVCRPHSWKPRGQGILCLRCSCSSPRAQEGLAGSRHSRVSVRSVARDPRSAARPVSRGP